MKILFATLQLPDNQISFGNKADYMSDLLFHGLRTIYGSDLTDYPKKDHMYNKYEHVDQLWGHGFTYANLLTDNPQVDRSDIVWKIQGNVYDLIIISIHHTVQMSYGWCENIISNIRNSTKSMIAVVDGHDLKEYNSNYLKYTNKFFKRELYDDVTELLPIHFAIPEEKIAIPINKTQNFANILPANGNSKYRRTHKYTTEQEYYHDYAKSKFALTCKKGGWDCLRHYEILANNCVPIFTDIEQCPVNTLTNLPKTILSELKLQKLKLNNKNEKCFDVHSIDDSAEILEGFDEVIYREYAAQLFQYTKDYLTTKKLGEYVIQQCLQ